MLPDLCPVNSESLSVGSISYLQNHNHLAYHQKGKTCLRKCKTYNLGQDKA